MWFYVPQEQTLSLSPSIQEMNPGHVRPTDVLQVKVVKLAHEAALLECCNFQLNSFYDVTFCFWLQHSKPLQIHQNWTLKPTDHSTHIMLWEIILRIIKCIWKCLLQLITLVLFSHLWKHFTTFSTKQILKKDRQNHSVTFSTKPNQYLIYKHLSYKVIAPHNAMLTILYIWFSSHLLKYIWPWGNPTMLNG